LPYATPYVACKGSYFPSSLTLKVKKSSVESTDFRAVTNLPVYVGMCWLPK